MATIYWRGRCAYLNWSDGTGQHRKSLGPVSAHVAENTRLAKELELRTGVKLFKPSELLGVVAVRYLDWHRFQYPDSHARVRFIVEHRLTQFHDRPLASLEQGEIEQWVAARSAEVKAQTVEKELRTLKALLNKAVEWKKETGLEANPAENVLPPQNVESEPIHWYTPAELKRLYKADRLHAACWQFLANTGLRRREAMHLRWTDIRDGSIWVSSREGARTKSAKWRQIPLSPGAATAMAKLKRGNKSIYVLPRMAKESWSRAFAKATERAKVGGSLHSLRHTFAANLVVQGVNLRVIQRLMGHATIKTTEQYAHVAGTTLESAVTNLRL
jgi:integrase